MDQTLSLGWAAGEARARRRTYRGVLAFNLACHIALILLALVSPDALSKIFGFPEPIDRDWVRAWAATLLLVTVLYYPGWHDPVRWRWGAVIGIIGRFWMASVFFLLGGAFWWFAAFDATFGVILAILYFRLFRAELMSRP
jgi:hypothetical protein